MHGTLRQLAKIGARQGDIQSRMMVDPAIRADPAPFYDELRELSATDGPLIRCRVGYLTVDHGLAQELLRSDDFRVIELDANLPGPLRWLEGRTRPQRFHPLRAPSLLAVEPPAHTRYRQAVSSAFTPRAVTVLRDGIRDTAEALLDDVERSGAGPAGAVDAMDRYCSQLPIAVISELLGVPDHQRGRLRELGESAALSLDLGLSWSQYRTVDRGLAAFDEWLTGHLAELRRNPGDDLLSRLIRAAGGGQVFTDDELRATAGLLLTAGFETTVNLLGNGVRLLLGNPHQLALLKDDPQMWPNAVEEILRLDSPAQLSVRLARRDVEIAGTHLRRDEMVAVYLGGANRDPAVFPDPHRFDVTRPNAGRHLTFSGGRHFCMGAGLARAEGEIGLRTFFDRFPHARASGTAQRRDTRVLRGWSTLPVRLGPDAGAELDGLIPRSDVRTRVPA